MNVAAIGRGPVLLDTVRLLHNQGHRIVGIAIAPENAESDLTRDHWVACARDLGSELTEDPTRLDADVAVSVNWPTRLPPETLALFPHGILNAHGGDLPRYRGNAPFAWAILNGESSVALTIHRMDAGLDSGPIFLKRRLPLLPETYIGDLYAALRRDVPGMFSEVLSNLLGANSPVPQTGTPLHCYPRSPEDGRIEWWRPADYIWRLVRASSEPFVGAFAQYRGEHLVVWRARPGPWREHSCAVPGQVVGRDNNDVAVATGEGLLWLQEIEYRGRRGAPGAVLRSSRERLHQGVVPG